MLNQLVREEEVGGLQVSRRSNRKLDAMYEPLIVRVGIELKG